MIFLGGDTYQYFYMDWYQIPRELKHAIWSEPYYDEGGGNAIMATFSVPFYQDIDGARTFRGIVTADISLTWLREIVSGGRLVEGGYRNPFHDPVALAAEELLLRRVVGALKDHPAIWVWNLGNEPDLFAWPENYQAGQAWVRRMVGVIRECGGTQPVTCGLHAASLFEDNGLHIDRVFAETDFGVMHAYPMYAPLARNPLDPDFVPFTCAVTAALCGKPVLMEEFGGCTVAPGEPSQVWEWQSYDLHKKQFMASEEDLAEFLRQTLPRLVQVGALGALVWCYADYAPELWDRPPCKEQRHERFFGLVRPDGTLKPHARVLQEFAASRPVVQPIPPYARLKVDAEKYYRYPKANAVRAVRLVRLFKQYINGLERFSK